MPTCQVCCCERAGVVAYRVLCVRHCATSMSLVWGDHAGVIPGGIHAHGAWLVEHDPHSIPTKKPPRHKHTSPQMWKSSCKLWQTTRDVVEATPEWSTHSLRNLCKVWSTHDEQGVAFARTRHGMTHPFPKQTHSAQVSAPKPLPAACVYCCPVVVFVCCCNTTTTDSVMPIVIATQHFFKLVFHNPHHTFQPP